jgi:hypothetical protein
VGGGQQGGPPLGQYPQQHRPNQGWVGMGPSQYQGPGEQKAGLLSPGENESVPAAGEIHSRDPPYRPMSELNSEQSGYSSARPGVAYKMAYGRCQGGWKEHDQFQHSRGGSLNRVSIVNELKSIKVADPMNMYQIGIRPAFIDIILITLW